MFSGVYLVIYFSHTERSDNRWFCCTHQRRCVQVLSLCYLLILLSSVKQVQEGPGSPACNSPGMRV